ncbi:hypothetical protein HAX54_045753 [Datura stramonium]|uniref:Uncharacterized protein n=1 Tax=Datura stramonium TaxID=4076 RepID=A0ABS8SR61_DATST|nr:hypothetical protein [Datura stramonium]
MGYVLSEGKWYKKVAFKPKPKAVAEDISFMKVTNVAMNDSVESLLKEALNIKEKLSAVVDDLHQVKLSLATVISTSHSYSEDLAKIQSQLALMQHEGVKSFNLVLKQVDSVAARAEVTKTRGASLIVKEYTQKEELPLISGK